MPRDAFPDAVRAVVRDELAGLGVCTIARVKAVADDTQRVTVELKNDPGWVDDDVPLVTTGPHRGGETGGSGPTDIPGIQPGDEVLVVFTADDVGDLTRAHGSAPDAGRNRTHGDVFALPLGAYTDADAVPDHAPGERILAHPNGTMIRMGPTGEDDLQLTHPSGARVRLNSGLAPDPEVGAAQDPAESPPAHEGVVELSHPSGVGVTVGAHGVDIQPGDTDGAANAGGYGYGEYGAGEYGAGGTQQSVVSVRAQNDPWRVEQVGDPQRPEEGHRHLVPQSDGSYAMTGPPLPHRELFAWFCVDANYSALVNSDAPDIADAQGFYQAYFEWLETVTGDVLDPAILGAAVDSGADWPYPEPVPSPADRESFRPTEEGD